MTELNRGDEPSVLSSKPSVLSEAQRCLFRPGVQLRMTAAILLCVFTALFPLMMPLGALLLLVPTIIFVLCPMLYGLAYMGEKAKNGESLSMRDLFIAFSRQYWHAIGSVVIWVLLLLVPVLLVIFCAVGAWAVYMLALATPAVSAYSYFVSVFGVIVTILSFLPALYLMRPAYFFLAIRVKAQKISITRAFGLSVRLISEDSSRYFNLQLKYAGLSILSCLSVCTLFPIYTLPLILIATPVHLDRLTEKEHNQPNK